MQIIYATQIIQIGQFARDALQENMFITFKQDMPPDLADFCFIHNHSELSADITPGDLLQINSQQFEISAVGEIASFNLKQLGHISCYFDGAKQAKFPGSIHLTGEIPPIEINSELKILKKG